MNILERIVSDTRDLLAERKRLVTQAWLESRPAFQAPTLSLETALSAPGISVIAEIKKASPSKGIIRADFDVEGLAQTYSHGGAAAISVLTEPTHFLGSLENLAIARRASDLPILRKDFIVDPYQLYEARAYGADAVLLIAAVLDRTQLTDLHQTATALGLSCLVEVYDPAELDRIDLDVVRVLGVNNRDLRTFGVDIDHSLRVFRQATASLVRVSESGLREPADLAYLERNGVDAVLIGETFMRARDPGLLLREFIARSRSMLDDTERLRLVV